MDVDMDSPPSSLPRASQTSLPSIFGSNAGSDKENASPVKRLNDTVQKEHMHPKLFRHALMESSDDEEQDAQEDDGNAYERVRLRLLGLAGDKSTSGPAKKTESAAQTSKSRTLASFSEDDMDDEEDSVVAAPRRGAMVSRMRGEDSPSRSRSSRITNASRSPSAGLVRNSSPARSLTRSPHQHGGSLFVSPRKASSAEDEHDRSQQSDRSDAEEATAKPMSKLEALVARKRAEREAAEREANLNNAVSDEDMLAADEPSRPQQKKAKATKKPAQGPVEVQSEGDSDKEVGEKFTQQARPTRKAGKKAIEEMTRETQRMSRNMQLTHQAKTKTKFTTADLFKKFKFRQTKASEPVPVEAQAGSSSVVASSDNERDPAHTPPSSPPELGDRGFQSSAKPPPTEGLQQNTAHEVESDDDLEAVMKLMRSKGSEDTQVNPMLPPTSETKPRERLSVRKFMKSAARPSNISDDELEIVSTHKSFLTGKRQSKPSRIAVLNQQGKPRSNQQITALRMLANLHDHEPSAKRGAPKSINPSELRTRLRRKAREQAALERNEKIAALKAKGIYVQSAEEKERDQLAVESMLERARLEADEIAKREKEAAKREGRDIDDGLGDSEDEDENYVASDEEDVDLSGSDEDEGEEEEVDESEGEADDNQDIARSNVLDDQADESDEEAEAHEAAVENDDQSSAELDADDEQVSAHPRNDISRRKRKTLVESDDEDELSGRPETVMEATPQRSVRTLMTPKSAKTAAAFGFNPAPPAGLGLSQMFAGTMADSDSDDDQQAGPLDSQQDSLAFLRGTAAPPAPTFGARTPGSRSAVQPTPTQVAGTQEATPSQAGLLHFETQSQLPAYDSQTGSPAVDATQDEGFAHLMSPLAGRVQFADAPHGTVSTVALSRATESPVKRRGRLQRMVGSQSPFPEASTPVAATQDDESVIGNEDFEITSDAFHIMRKASKKSAAPVAYDKKNSKAAEMVEEQAEESEDEYAGLGGASDDEDAAEADAEVQKIIDDETREKLNERQIAALHAENELAENEKGVEKLYKDIINGGLRRKRGAEMDLWDSDDEDEAARRRRAAKQREFAKMRKELLKDEGVAKIAENPKQMAFLAAIEDRPEDDDIFILEEQNPSNDSNSQSQGSQDKAAPGDEDLQVEARSTKGRASSRRSTNFSKPTSIAAIRNTLSELLDEPDSILDSQPEMLMDDEEQQIHSEDDYEEDDFVVDDEPELKNALQSEAVEDMPPPPSQSKTTRPAVIDRRSIAARRANSRQLPANQARLAFQSMSSLSASKVPSLLRRATTNASNASDSTSGGMGGMGKEVVKMGGTKRSSVNFQVREAEKRRRVESVEVKKRKEMLKVGRARGSDLGVEGGMFE